MGASVCVCLYVCVCVCVRAYAIRQCVRTLSLLNNRLLRQQAACIGALEQAQGSRCTHCVRVRVHVHVQCPTTCRANRL